MATKRRVSGERAAGAGLAERGGGATRPSKTAAATRGRAGGGGDAGGGAGRGATRAGAKSASRNGAKRVERTRVAVIPRERLAQEIGAIVRYKHLTQAEAARVVGDAPSQMSLLLTGKLDGFSTDRLLRMLLRLGRDVDLVVRPAAGNRQVGRLKCEFR